MQTAEAIRTGHTCLGIEFGSTRIKAVLIDDAHTVLAQGGCHWENRLEDGIWTYSLEEALHGMQACYAELADTVRQACGVPLETVGCIGISGMMHGLLALGADGKPVLPFRTWRNLMTAEAAAYLTKLFSFPIPERWSVAHLAQLLSDGAEEAKDICRMTTLAGYFHAVLTGEHVLGCTEASGMFPIDPAAGTYDARMVQAFAAFARERGFDRTIPEIFPRVLPAGAEAGRLTETGARLLDPTGVLRPGIPFCPPEGDGATGLVSTGSPETGCAAISAGTSVFGVFVTDHFPETPRPELEGEVSPSGKPLVQIHGNNGCADLDAWAGIFADGMKRLGAEASAEQLYAMLLSAALEPEADGGCSHGGVLAYNYISGEHLTKIPSGAPLLLRRPDSPMTLPHLLRSELFAVFAPLALGVRLLWEEGIYPRQILAHGGMFRTQGPAQRVLAAALHAPVSVRREAGEGGPFGMALLAAYAKNHAAGETLEAYLAGRVFAGKDVLRAEPEDALVSAYDAYLADYTAGLDIARSAGAFCASHPAETGKN